MKQLLQDVATGEVTVQEVPAPTRAAASLLVATQFSLISAGTERAVLDLGRASLVGKARARPDLARKVLESARTEGLAATYSKVRGRLDEPNALGYSLCGMVLEACEDSPAAPGELVACAGAGLASHAEVVSVPRTLCARVPEDVPAKDAAYATVAAIALHGVRLSGVRLGDVVAVVGLGLVGQLAAELLTAAGCVVVGCDPDEGRVNLAREAGLFATTDPDDLRVEAERLTNGRGADGVLVTAASHSSAPLNTATAVARERATVVIVGDVALESPRAPLFAKELKLVVSRSYGPGRYDPVYEERGIDYPAGYVRWTEGRNLGEVLRLMATGALNPSRLTTHVFGFDDGPAAYRQLESDEPSIGILLEYPGLQAPGDRVVALPGPSRPRVVSRHKLRVAVVGAGTFARSVLMPQVARHSEIVAVATATGISARAAAARFGASTASTDAKAVLESPDVDAVLIATRHDTHSLYAASALQAGKHVFVEKPLALDEIGLKTVEDAAASGGGILMVGFNRRFAPHVQKIKALLGAVSEPKAFVMTVNAGAIPAEHWAHDPTAGGGRVAGEACHFIDLLRFLAGAPITEFQAMSMAGASRVTIGEDRAVITLRFADGSLGTIQYLANGHKAFPKERLDVFAGGRVLHLDNFRTLTAFGWPGFTRLKLWRQDKGQRACAAAFVRAVEHGGVPPIPLAELLEVSRVTVAVATATAQGRS